MARGSNVSANLSLGALQTESILLAAAGAGLGIHDNAPERVRAAGSGVGATDPLTFWRHRVLVSNSTYGEFRSGVASHSSRSDEILRAE